MAKKSPVEKSPAEKSLDFLPPDTEDSVELSVELPVELPPETVESETEPKAPSWLDPEWTQHVLSQLRPNEKNKDGHPTTDGLWRMTEVNLGPITRSVPTSVVVTDERTTVTHEIDVHYPDGTLRTFGAVACCGKINGSFNCEEEFARFAGAMAGTRAKGRCYRDALHLVKVVTAEEMTNAPVAKATYGSPGAMTESQKNAIRKIAGDLDINLKVFINSKFENIPQGNYQNLHDVPKEYVTEMIKILGQMQRKAKQIPDRIIGYDHSFGL